MMTSWLMPFPRKEDNSSHAFTENGRLQLFFFPHAGGGASAFYQWSRVLPPDITCYAVQLPGREMRVREPLYRQVSPLVQALTAEIRPYLHTSFVFWGHSMGALLSFEVARALQQQGFAMPQRLIVSGYNAPHVPYADPHIHHLPQPDFIAALQELNGTPQPILQNNEMRELFLPIIRADFQLVETYSYQDAEPLNCPIIVLDGVEDEKTNEAGLQAWQRQSSLPLKIFTFSGDHFFLYDRQPALIDTVIHILQTYPTGFVKSVRS